MFVKIIENIGQIFPTIGSIIIVFGLKISSSPVESTCIEGKEYKNSIIISQHTWMLKVGLILLIIGLFAQLILLFL